MWLAPTLSGFCRGVVMDGLPHPYVTRSISGPSRECSVGAAGLACRQDSWLLPLTLGRGEVGGQDSWVLSPTQCITSGVARGAPGACDLAGKAGKRVGQGLGGPTLPALPKSSLLDTCF